MLEIEIVNNINTYLECKGIHFSNELRMGVGIPDISLNIGATRYLKPMDDYFLLSILEFVNKKHCTSFHEIKNEFLITLDKVKQYVVILAKMSFVKVKNDIVRAIKNIFSAKLGTTISIEAKLKDWRGACLQAQRYLCFSDYAYIAMPSNYIKNIEQKLFVESGIGILSVEGNKVEEILSARKSDSCEFTLKYLITSKIIEKSVEMGKKHLRKNIFTPLL
jgi:hypothetical protein